MALCVIVHAVGTTGTLRWLRHATARVDARFWFTIWLLVRTAGWIILLHLVEIAVWAFFYTWKHAMPDLQSALYFSAVTYTTTGYGDLLLPNEWRMVGGVEALTGILMCGWSAAFFVAVVSRINEMRSKPEQT
jgi:voltage-gated potassium channel Kch